VYNYDFSGRINILLKEKMEYKVPNGGVYMNKNIKRIIALALVFGTVSAVAPATGVNLLTTKAYASTTNDDDEFSSLELKDGDGTKIRLYKDDDYDEKADDDDLSDTDKFYAKTSSSKIKLDIDGVNDKYVKVFTSDSDNAKGKDVDDEISISSDKTIYIKIYDEDVSDETVKYDDDDDDYNEIGKYEIEVEHKGSSNDDDDSDDYDDIYLDKLTVDGKEITLSDSKVVYDYNVASNVDKVTIKAEPDDDDADNDYDVSIDGTDVDSSDNYKKTVNLKTGVNEIKIELNYEDDDDDKSERDYTLKITRAAATGTVTDGATTVPAVTRKADQWVQVNGRWQYNDSQGNPTKNAWFFDRNYGKWYFLGVDGNMQIGWILVGGKYYYLYSDGSMAANTTINGYKVDASGAWITK